MLVLGLAACGNSTSDSTSSTTAGSTKTTVPTGGGEAHRNEKVSLSGVPGVTDDAISYDVVATKTGNPLGTCILDCYVEGIKAYFAFRNSQGGIYGRDLKINKVIDDELGQNQARSLDVVSANDAFGNFQATLLASGWGDLDKAGIPTYVWGINGADSANRTHNFPSTIQRCASCPRPIYPYAAEKAGATKAAAIGYGTSENSKVCTNTIAESYDVYEKESGVKGVYTNDHLDFGLPNGIGPEVTAMKKAGVQFIATCIDLNGMKTLAQELDRQGMNDVVLFHQNTYDPDFVAQAGKLFEGDDVAVGFRPFEASAKGTAMEDFLTWMDKQGSTPTELAMTGWLNASLAFDGLLATGPKFDRQKVTDATNSFTDYTAGGLTEPTDWTTGHTTYTKDAPDSERSPTDCAALVKVKDAKFVAFDDPAKPWLCWKGGKKVDFEPTPTNFS
ncbi:ABC transporter substrate-binding protein [Aquihabitans sp. McL0605]|uniref:ABC transporter substrate-binding protein n=1 Tax=Aquihabitans sp. McL0605 TaxID=3415671 RepID=UPI003CF1FB71